jgi:hypothetical protein
MSLTAKDGLIWYVAGVPNWIGVPMMFESKEAAEVFARHCFPNDPPKDRVATLRTIPLWTLEDMKAGAFGGMK